MSLAERVTIWNRWYDTAPEEWRFQFVVWSLLALGTVNMALTVAVGFPFALLVLVGIIAITAIRLPYVLGWVTSPAGADGDSNIQIEGAGWLIDLNHQYEALPELRRLWVYPAALLIAGAINMMLTIRYGFPFGLLFLAALLALVIFRAPYTAGWLRSSAPTTAPATLGAPVQALPPAVGDHSPAFGPSNEEQVANERAGWPGSSDSSIDHAAPESSGITGLSGDGPVEPHDREVKKGGE